MKKLADFLYAIMAGAFIAMGGVVFLSLNNKIVGAFMFSLGLFAVCTLKYNLFTGKVGYCLLYTSPSPRDGLLSRMPSSA